MVERAPAEVTRPIKVLSFLTTSGYGGTEMQVLYALRHLDPALFEMETWILRDPGPLAQLFLQGGRVKHFGYRGNLLRVAASVARALCEQHFDILHLYGLKVNLIGRLLGAALGYRNVVCGQRNIDSHRRALHVWLDRLTSPLVNMYVSNSYAGRDILLEREKIPASKIQVVHNGIDLTRFRCKWYDPNVSDSSHTTTILICVASLTRKKDHVTLVEAALRLKQRGYSFQLWLVGDGPERANIVAEIETRDLANYVHMLGVRDDVPDLLMRSDIFVLSSLWEGLPNAVMEAMAVGLPVVSTDVGGVQELIVHGDTGLLVSPGEPVALAQTLETLMVDRQRAKQIGLNANRYIQSHFDISARVAQLGHIYMELVGM